jgi:hypothetical protein
MLYQDRINGAVVCEDHAGPVRHSDCYDFVPMTDIEESLWREFITSIHGPNAPLCEWCRARVMT